MFNLIMWSFLFGLLMIILIFVCFGFIFRKFSGVGGSVKLLFLGWFVSVCINFIAVMYISTVLLKAIFPSKDDLSTSQWIVLVMFAISMIYWMVKFAKWQIANKDRIREAFPKKPKDKLTNL